MKRYRKFFLSVMLFMLAMFASGHSAFAESGFVTMEYGATAVVGKPFTIVFVPGFGSSAYKFATIEIVDPDKNVTSEDFHYTDMYERIEYTFTPEKTGLYIIRGYSSIKTTRVDRNYMTGQEKTYTSITQTTATKETTLMVSKESQATEVTETGTGAKKEASLSATAKTFKAKTKTKKYSVTLKTKEGKAIKNAKLTLKINGKTYKASTNIKGKAVFKITKLTKKGTYTAKVKFAGNKSYKGAGKKVKIKIKK